MSAGVRRRRRPRQNPEARRPREAGSVRAPSGRWRTQLSRMIRRGCESRRKASANAVIRGPGWVASQSSRVAGKPRYRTAAGRRRSHLRRVATRRGDRAGRRIGRSTARRYWSSADTSASRPSRGIPTLRQRAAKYQRTSPNSSSTARRYPTNAVPSRRCFLTAAITPPTSPKRPSKMGATSCGPNRSVSLVS